MPHHFFTEDNVALELTFKKLFLKLWPFLLKHKKKVYVSLLIITAYVVSGRILPFLFGYAVDNGIKGGHPEIIAWIAALYFVLEGARGGLAFWQNDYVQRFGNLVLFEIREKLIRHVQHLPVSYFEKNPSGRTVTRVTNDIFALGELFGQGFAVIFVSLIEMASIFVSLTLISPPMTGIILLVLPPLFAICYWLSRRIRHQFGAAKRKLSMINAFSAESFSGIKILQLFDQTRESRAMFCRMSREYKELQLSTLHLFAMLWPVIEAFNLFTLATALLIGAYAHQKYGLSLGELSAYLLLLQGFFKPLKTILERYNQLQNSLASADRVFQLLDEQQEDQVGSSFAKEKLSGSIEYRNVSFRYTENASPALNNVSLKIEPGQSVALVGRTGSGKSTMIALLQKFYPMFEGDILIDGMSLHEVASPSLRPRIGVVQQDGFVFSGTIFDNISLFDPRITRERAAWAAEQAQCQELIRKHGGLDGHVQERGSNLSSGERQLLAFARALALDPDVLILDEATANIDSVSERHIQKATDRVTAGRTSLIIAHRLSTILHCDQIVVMDQGKIVEIGRHEDLIAKRERYYELYRLQFLKDSPAAERPAQDSWTLVR